MTEVTRKCNYCKGAYYRKVGSSIKVWQKRKYCSQRCAGFSARGRKHTAEHKRKISEALKRKDYSHMVGVPHGHKTNNGMRFSLTAEQRQKVSKALKGVPRPERRGKNNPSWRGGVTPLNKQLRMTLEYKEWRTKVFLRDSRKCIWCGSGKKIEADHIKPMALYPELIHDIDNGRTLCHDCHVTTDTYAGNTRKPKIIEPFEVR